MQRLALLLTAGLATVLVALALTSVSASAANFCENQRVSSIQSCFGTPRMIYEFEWARADDTGVCVGYNEVIYGACSPHAWANELAILVISGYVTPRVIGQGRLTVAHGQTF